MESNIIAGHMGWSPSKHNNHQPDPFRHSPSVEKAEEELGVVKACLEPGRGETSWVSNQNGQALFCSVSTVVLDSVLGKDDVRMNP